MKILHLHASPRTEGSHSYTVAQQFLAALKQKNARIEVDELNVWEEKLPQVDQKFLSVKTKSAGNEPLTNGELVLWTHVESLIGRIKSADALVLTTPMWNFGVPYALKHFIDVVTQHGYLFEYGEQGIRGLLEKTPTLAVIASGGDYTESSGMQAYDQVTPYLNTVLGFWGIDAPEIISIPSTMGDSESVAAIHKSVEEKVVQIAQDFLPNS